MSASQGPGGAGPPGQDGAQRLSPLDVAAIRAALGARASELAGLEVVAETGSTNADLLARPPGRCHAHALLAETQTAGRGRRGRRWQSPPRCSIHLSLGWRFPTPAADLGFLPLALAVSVACTLEAAGLEGHGVKWPNDLLVDGRKLGGCLVELAPRRDATRAVLGLGLNVDLSGAAATAAIDQPWTDLAAHLPDPDRNALAGALIGRLVDDLHDFAAGLEPGRPASGFDRFRADWARFDLLSGQRVCVSGEGGDRSGIARGPGPGGGLLLEDGGRRDEIMAGDARLRPVERQED